MRWLFLVLVVTSTAFARPEHAALLRQVADNWLNERGHWAFTQVVREYDDTTLKQERRERYDPSRGWANRWELISIDNRAPTDAERETWMHRKNKKPRKNKPTATESFDFENAKVIEETAQTVRYELPLRNGIEWLFPTNKVELVITINKTGPALEQVQARISEPFRVALGLARILDIDLDLQMAPPPTPDPADAKPSGTAHAVVTKFGDRVEYFWSEFKRVPESADGVDGSTSSKS
jgi:hypothetical protein